MKLTGDLKKKVEATDVLEEKKNIIEDAGMELTEDELKDVTGGAYWERTVQRKSPSHNEIV